MFILESMLTFADTFVLPCIIVIKIQLFKGEKQNSWSSVDFCHAVRMGKFSHYPEFMFTFCITYFKRDNFDVKGVGILMGKSLASAPEFIRHKLSVIGKARFCSH
jgi:hypothetical protein